MNVFYCTTSSDYFRLFNDIDLVSIFSSSKWGLFISGMIFSYKCTALWTNSPVSILCGHWESNDWYWHQQHQQTQHQHPLMCSILTVYCLYIKFLHRPSDEIILSVLFRYEIYFLAVCGYKCGKILLIIKSLNVSIYLMW